MTGGLPFDSIGAKLYDLGYRPAPKSRPPDFAPVPELILLYIAGLISRTAAEELVRAVAEWARGKLSRRKGGTKVTLWGPDHKVLAEVEVPEDDGDQ